MTYPAALSPILLELNGMILLAVLLISAFLLFVLLKKQRRD